MPSSNFELRNLSCQFGERVILENVSVTLETGECVALIGPNGSGKSTLLNCIGGFVDSRGEILWRNIRLDLLKPFQRAQLGVARIFQNPGIFKTLSVLDNLRVAYEARSAHKIAEPDYLALLERVDLHRLAHRSAGLLSGGQLRLLEILRLFCTSSELLLLDEPTAGVSPKLKGVVLELLLEFKMSGRTILLVEHDINFVSELCDRVLVLAQGSVFFDGGVGAAKNSAAVQELYLGRAYNKD